MLRGVPKQLPPTRREWLIIELAGEGLRGHEIAKCIGTTEQVVKNYLAAIYDKLGLWTRLELALWYEQNQPPRMTEIVRDERGVHVSILQGRIK